MMESKGVRESEGVMDSKGIAIPSIRGRGVSGSHIIKGVSVCPSFHPSRSTLDAYISGVYGPIFVKFGLLVDPPLLSAIPGARPGLTRGGAGQCTGVKKNLFSRVGKNLNLNILRVRLPNTAKPGVLLDI